MFQTQYDMIVRNYQHFKQCLQPPNQQKRLMMEDYHLNLNRFKVKHCPLIQHLFSWLIWQWTKLEFKLKFKHVDKSKMVSCPLKILTNHPIKYRLMIILFMFILKLMIRVNIFALGKSYFQY